MSLHLKWVLVEEDQDGGVGGCGAHLPPQTHQNTSTCGTAVMETDRRTSVQTKLQERSAHNWVGRKKRHLVGT